MFAMTDREEKATLSRSQACKQAGSRRSRKSAWVSARLLVAAVCLQPREGSFLPSCSTQAFAGLPGRGNLLSTLRGTRRHAAADSSTSVAPADRGSNAAPADSLRLAPLGVASAVMSLLGPLFRFQAPLQAGKYDKWQVRKALEAEVKSAPVVIYTYDASPFSAEAKRLLGSVGADYREISLGAEWFVASPEAAAKRAELGKMHGRTSLPHIFIGGRSVGGLMDGSPGLVPLQESGELTASLKKAGALPDDGLFGFFLYSGDHKDDY